MAASVVVLPTYYRPQLPAPVTLPLSHPPRRLPLETPLAASLSANASLCSPAGYGFVDFDSPAAAQKAVSSLKATGVQAQMAKVGSR